MKKQLIGLLKGVQYLREHVDAEMQLQQLVILLEVGKNPGITQREVSQLYDISAASMSRNVSALSDTHWKGHGGHKLIIQEPMPRQRRQNMLRLTGKGERLLEKLAEVMEG